MASSPIHLTIYRRGDTHIVDLAEVQAIIPRSETRVEAVFLDEISQELKRITNVVDPEFRKSGSAAGLEAKQKPRVVDELKDLGSLIFSHLLPDAARNRLRSADSCDLYLRLDDQLVRIPWELAFDGQQFLGMKFRIGRQVITHHRAAQTSPYRAESDTLRVLIVSDPSESLKNVSRESEQLCEILDKIPGFQVRLLGGRSVKRISLLAALRQSDIVHFAGHSQFDEKNPGNSGWLLYDGLLSASEISKLDQAPLLVFSNSCQAAATNNWRSDYLFEGEAFGLGSAFLLAGVSNYVGTFCVVHDEESRFFAVEFYQHIAEGKSVGQALLEARLATSKAMGLDRLTWASYMLYGDPAYVLPPTRKEQVAPVIQLGGGRLSAAQDDSLASLTFAEPRRWRLRWPRVRLRVSVSITVALMAVLVFSYLLKTELHQELAQSLRVEPNPSDTVQQSSRVEHEVAPLIPENPATKFVGPRSVGPQPESEQTNQLAQGSQVQRQQQRRQQPPQAQRQQQLQAQRRGANLKDITPESKGKEPSSAPTQPEVAIASGFVPSVEASAIQPAPQVEEAPIIASRTVPREEKSAGIGAVEGAAAGGMIGSSAAYPSMSSSAVGRPGTGAAIGAVLGAGAGALIGDQLQSQGPSKSPQPFQEFKEVRIEAESVELIEGKKAIVHLRFHNKTSEDIAIITPLKNVSNSSLVDDAGVPYRWETISGMGVAANISSTALWQWLVIAAGQSNTAAVTFTGPETAGAPSSFSFTTEFQAVSKAMLNEIIGAHAAVGALGGAGIIGACCGGSLGGISGGAAILGAKSGPTTLNLSLQGIRVQ